MRRPSRGGPAGHRHRARLIGLSLGVLGNVPQFRYLGYLNAVSVHPYRDKQHPPETAAADYHKLRQLLEACEPPTNRAKIPIISGEWGYSTQQGGVSPETQANFAVRQQLCNLLAGIPLSIWYDWKNDKTDPADNEQNFGTVNHDLTPKPAYLAIQKMTRELGGFCIVRRLELASQDDYALLCAGPNKGQYKLVAWTMGQPHSLKLESAALAPELEGAGARPIDLELTASPQYLALGASPR